MALITIFVATPLLVSVVVYVSDTPIAPRPSLIFMTAWIVHRHTSPLAVQLKPPPLVNDLLQHLNLHTLRLPFEVLMIILAAVACLTCVERLHGHWQRTCQDVSSNMTCS
jgi:hypothetical protein